VIRIDLNWLNKVDFTFLLWLYVALAALGATKGMGMVPVRSKVEASGNVWKLLSFWWILKDGK
jgi:hypothetical protein